jgi:predicted phosphohydrolase
MKLIWTSDVHLNFLGKQPDMRNDFYQQLKEADGEVILITGDIAESECVVRYITEIMDYTQKPIYFVLGNHDFYGSNIAQVKRSVKSLGWLGGKQFIELSATTALIGVDGWGDCRNGDYENSRLTMSDWIYIDDLRKEYGKGMAPLKKQLMRLADLDANKLKRRVQKVLKNSSITRIIIASHVPPFEEVCLNAGKKSTPSGLPFFSSKCLGDAILPIAKKNPQVDFLWLSGHTHSRAKHKPCNNLQSKVARAEYYLPRIEEIINV